MEKVVLLLGMTEVMVTRGGRDMTTLTNRYLECIRSLAKLTEVSVIEMPMIRPDGNYSGAVIFNMDIKKGIPEDVQFVETEAEANRLIREKLIKSGTTQLN